MVAARAHTTCRKDGDLRSRSLRAASESVAVKEQKGNMPRDELRALEREIEREWWWLNGALHAVAQAHSDGFPQSIRQIAAQKLAVDRKRVEIASRIDARPWQELQSLKGTYCWRQGQR